MLRESTLNEGNLQAAYSNMSASKDMVTVLSIFIFAYCKVTAGIKLSAEDIIFSPISNSTCYSGGKATLQYDITGSLQEYIQIRNDSTLYLGVNYKEKQERWSKVVAFEEQRNWAGNQKLEYQTSHRLNSPGYNSSSEEFLMYLNGIGHIELQIEVIEVTDYNKTKVIVTAPYKLTATRKQRLVDRAFNSSIAILAILNAFALGCISDIKLVKHELKKPIKMAITFLTQYCVLPLVS